MRQHSPLASSDPKVGAAAVKRARQYPTRLAITNRRTQVLAATTAQFALTGLHGTTTEALAKAVGISEPILYVHFDGKECLFRAAVEANIEIRLTCLRTRLTTIVPGSPIRHIQNFAVATVAVCVFPASNVILTNWALLEIPEYAVNVHRREIRMIAALWERELRTFPGVAVARAALQDTCCTHGQRLPRLRLLARRSAIHPGERCCADTAVCHRTGDAGGETVGAGLPTGHVIRPICSWPGLTRGSALLGRTSGCRKTALDGLLTAEIMWDIEALLGRQSLAELDLEALESAVRRQALRLAGSAIEQRLTGMQWWTIAGSNAIIALRRSKPSGRFQDFWERRSDRRAA